MIVSLLAIAAAAEPHTWDLAHIFPDIAAFEQAVSEVEAGLPQLEACQGTLAQSSGQLADCVELQWALGLKESHLWGYAENHNNADLRDDAWQRRKGVVTGLWSRFNTATSWVEPELQALSDEAKAWIDTEPRLAPYRYPLKATLRHADHTLSAGEERILALTENTRSAPQDTYGILTAAEVPWPTLTLDGAEVRLQPSAYTKFRTHPDRAVRRQVFDTFFQTYGDYQDTLGSLLATTVKGHWGVAQARGFDSSVAQALDKEFLPPAIYDTLIEEAHAGRPTLHRYFKLRARLMGVDDLGYHDLYVPLVASDQVFDVETSKELTWKSAKPLGPDYVKALKAGLEGGWTDVYPREGKRPGAYMSGAAYGIHPYVLLNHNDDWASCTTMAHEMGHAMHTHLTMANQPFATADYATFIAEIASTFNENLLLDYMLSKAKTDDERLFYLGNHLEMLRTTFFRQAMFGEYERMIHDAHEKGTPLTGPALTEMYGQLLRDTHGHDQGVVSIAETDTYEWAFIPHFYYDFYVWQYATSLAASSLLAQRVMDKEPGALEAYLELLSAGGSDDPHVLLQKAGVDMTSPEPYRAVVQQMNDIMTEMERILDKQGKR
jgi:oligoendopeptidase F